LGVLNVLNDTAEEELATDNLLSPISDDPPSPAIPGVPWSG